jgi:hypothetical protein
MRLTPPASGIDHLHRALEPQGIGDASADETGLRRHLVRVDVFQRRVLLAQPRVIGRTDADKDACRAPAQGIDGNRGLLERFPGDFQGQPLLGIHPFRFSR